VRNVSETILSSLKSRFNQPWLLLLLFLGVLVALGSTYMQKNTLISKINETANHVSNAVWVTDVGSPKAAIKKRDSSLEDIESQHYQQENNTLIKLEYKETTIRFVYIYSQKKGEIYCIVADSEPVQ